VLARPELQRFTEAATYFESAAVKAQTPVVAAMMLNRQARCCWEGRMEGPAAKKLETAS
jgi:hypothetical protein